MTGLKHAYHGRSHRRFGSDPIGTENQRMPRVHLAGDLNGQTIPSGSDYYPELTGIILVPLNAGGTNDAEVFGAIDTGDAPIEIETGGSSNEPFKWITIRQPGLYWLDITLGWFLDWGLVRVNYEVDHSDGDDSITTTRHFVHNTENSYFGGASDATAPQIGVTAQTLVTVDERATDVTVRGFAHNASGSSRTYTGDHVLGEFSLNLVQLSTSGYTNPPQ